MTKLIVLKLTIPTGDEVTTDALQRAVRRALETVEPDEPAQVDGLADHRIHWGAVGVVRLVDRSAQAERRAGFKPAVGARPL